MIRRGKSIPVEIVTEEEWVVLDRIFTRLSELKKIAGERLAKAEAAEK